MNTIKAIYWCITLLAVVSFISSPTIFGFTSAGLLSYGEYRIFKNSTKDEILTFTGCKLFNKLFKCNLFNVDE